MAFSLAWRAGRLAFLPVRVAARSPLGGAATRGLAATGRSAEAEARRRVEHALANGTIERVVSSALEAEQTERIVREVLGSPRLEKLVDDTLDSALARDLTNRLLEGPELDRLVKRIASSPELRTALTSQTRSFGEEVVDAIRSRAAHLDDVLESGPRRLVRKPARTAPAGYGGVATRGVALAVDAVLIHVIFLMGAAFAALLTSLFGKPDSPWLVGGLLTSAWLLVVSAYFVTFWSGVGQTPGMRSMHLRVVTARGVPPGFGRSLVRLLGLAFATGALLIGFLPVLVDDKRRALQDFLAGTRVVAADPAVIARPPL